MPCFSRSYPRAFGMAVARLAKRHLQLNPNTTMEAPVEDLSCWVRQLMPWDGSWEDARLGEVFQYLCRNKRLHLEPGLRRSLVRAARCSVA